MTAERTVVNADGDEPIAESRGGMNG